MIWALITNGTVQNLIVYDGTSPYTPPDGLTLQQVQDDKQINEPAGT